MDDDEELRIWQEEQRRQSMEKYGVNIYEKRKTFRRKRVDNFSKILDIIIKIFTGVIILIIVLVVIFLLKIGWGTLYKTYG